MCSGFFVILIGAKRLATMIEKDDPLRLRIEALRVLARTNQPNRAVLIERNIEDYPKTAGSERAALVPSGNHIRA
jgi:hypothetical protein